MLQASRSGNLGVSAVGRADSPRNSSSALGEEVCGYVDQMNARLSVITKCEVSIHLPSSPSIKLRSDEHETTKNVINKVIHLGSSLVREETY